LKQIKSYLKGDLTQFSRAQVKKIAKYADQYVLDSNEVLYFLCRPTRNRPRNKESELRLVVPTDLRADILHYAHEDFQGGHQGITRTYERLRSEFFWLRMYADAEVFVKECTDCVSAKGQPPNSGPSPGNIEPRFPFEAVSMDFATHLPKSERGNTFLLLFPDVFSGYVMCKPMSSTTAQDVAEVYEEQVFRRFGASSLVRHDQDPRFMSEVFTRFRELLGSKQRATLAYRPQDNGQQERSVQTTIRSIRAYVAEADQSDWDEDAERLMFALNTSFDATRLDTPFYLIHGWDAQGTLSAMLGHRWVTKVIYAAKSWPVAIKVVNISDKLTWIDPGTDVARIVEYGFFPQAGRYVRPGKRKYQEWQQLIYESTLSAQAQLRADKLEQLRCAKEPPCVQRPSYPWPSKILLRPDPVTAEVRMARLQVQPKSVRVTPVPNDAECDHVLRWLASAFRRSLSVTTVRMEIALRRLRLALKLRTRM